MDQERKHEEEDDWTIHTGAWDAQPMNLCVFGERSLCEGGVSVGFVGRGRLRMDPSTGCAVFWAWYSVRQVHGRATRSLAVVDVASAVSTPMSCYRQVVWSSSGTSKPHYPRGVPCVTVRAACLV